MIIYIACLYLLFPFNGLKNELCPYFCGTDGLKAKFMIYLITNGIVDTADHLLDFEDFFCDLACHNVSIIAIGDGCESISVFNTGPYQHLLIDTIANQGLA